jgi:hypothetical protein
MRAFATIRKQRGGSHLTALGWNLLLAQKAKQQSYQVDEDVQLFPVNLNKEGFVANLHSDASCQPSTFARWGLIALSAIALTRAIPHSPQLCNQMPPIGVHQLFQDSRKGAA